MKNGSSLVIIVYLAYASSTTEESYRRQVFNLGFPKSGTTSLAEFLTCIGYSNVTHWACNSTTYYYCADCISAALKINEPVEKYCGHHDAYAQMDFIGAKSCSLPQLSFRQLDRLHPGSIFILEERNFSSWIKSVRSHPNGLESRMKRCALQYQYQKEEANNKKLTFHVETVADAFLERWVQSHVNDVKEYFRNRSSDFLAFNMEEPSASKTLHSFFVQFAGFSRNQAPSSCWTQRNAHDITHHNTLV